MDFWTRVTVQEPIEAETSTGNVRLSWEDVEAMTDIEARVLPLVIDERKETWATPEEDAYEVQLRHSYMGVRPKMRVVVEAAVYDIRRVQLPPPFGIPTTILQCVRVTP